jgi:phospholipid/cholesterol/gamma-HCH transport system substrate-binding protein
MLTAIRAHLRDFLAILGLALVALVATGIIVQEQRLRIPVLEERPFELKAEMQTAQAVMPGQGQTVRVAGVRIGDISDVQLEEGNAVVTMDIDRKFLPIYKDATILLRPKTGLKDMFLELDPGNAKAGEYEEGDTIPVANTAPDVNLDEVLQFLDTDTRAYLRALLVGGGEGLRGRGKDLGEVLGSLGPINRALAKLNREVAKRRDSLARFIHNFNLVTQRVGSEPEEISAFVDASNSALSAIAEQDPDVRRATRLLGPTLHDTRVALGYTHDMAEVLGPTLNHLRPFARRLEPVNNSLGRLARTTKDDLRDRIRPFVRAARKPVRDLRPTAQRLARATPKLTVVGSKLNKLFNMAAYNPNGAEPPGTPNRDEGYLYWAGWLGHVTNSTFSAQDAHGVYRKVYLTANCEAAAALVGSTPLAPVLTGLDVLFNSGGPFQGGCGP